MDWCDPRFVLLHVYGTYGTYGTYACDIPNILHLPKHPTPPKTGAVLDTLMQHWARLFRSPGEFRKKVAWLDLES